MNTDRQILTNQEPKGISELYEKYAGMLLGYLYEIVKDSRQAEQHLVNIYRQLPQHLHTIYADGTNVWCQLQRFAKNHLSANAESTSVKPADKIKVSNKNKFMALMTQRQKQVFYDVYYCSKTTAQLAKELKMSEDIVRKVLKEAFMIIKKAS